MYGSCHSMQGYYCKFGCHKLINNYKKCQYCNSGAPVTAKCLVCNKDACRHDSLTYLSNKTIHSACMKRYLKRGGIGLINISHLFDGTAELYKPERYDFRPICSYCGKNDSSIEYMVLYRSEGFVHPKCISDERFYKWAERWRKLNRI